MESILVIDDDISVCNALKEELSEVGYDVQCLYDGSSAAEFLLNNPVDLVLLDLKMPGKDGFEVLKEINQQKVKPKIIVLTAYADVKSAIDSAKMGASDFISKPYDFDELLITIRKVIQKDGE
ncbi:MAG: hypothetical protein Kow0098_06960 [Ignavibacteriaceae bacterium]